MKFISIALFSAFFSTQALANNTIRIAHATPESAPVHQAMLYFQQEIEKRSDGSIKVDIFPAGQLGSIPEMTELVQSGNITMTTGASVHLSSTVDQLAILDQFLLFKDEATAHALLDGEAGKSLSVAMEAKGLKNLGFMELGFRSFTNSRKPLDSYEAFSGLRLRSADNPIAIKAWRSVGAVPVPLAWGEIYSSLQQGLIDGQESALSSMVIERFFEVQQYVSLTDHMYWPELWLANADWYAELAENDRTLIDEVARETVLKQRELTAAANAVTLGQLEEAGLKVNSLPVQDKERLGEVMNASIAEDIRTKVGDEFYNSFMQLLQK